MLISNVCPPHFFDCIMYLQIRFVDLSSMLLFIAELIVECMMY